MRQSLEWQQPCQCLSGGGGDGGDDASEQGSNKILHAMGLVVAALPACTSHFLLVVVVVVKWLCLFEQGEEKKPNLDNDIHLMEMTYEKFVKKWTPYNH